MAACKRPRENKCTPEAPASPEAETEWTLPADLLLEIIARSDARTLVRCAAASKLLRRDILSPSFIHLVTQQGGVVPRCILAYLNTHDDVANPPPPLSLVHPATPAAASFLDCHMSPYMSFFAGDLLAEHVPVTFRGGLVLLRRRRASNTLSNLCVYDLFTGHRTFFSDPPDIGSGRSRRYHLLTSADGIGCSFLLFAANLDGMAGNNRHMIQVQTATSTCGTWAPAATIHESSGFLKRAMHRDAVVFHGGVMHWLVRRRGEIVTYNVHTMEQGRVQLPIIATNFKGYLYLGSYYSHHGRKLLRFLVSKGCKISLWHQLSGGDWASEPITVDMEEMLRSLDPGINTGQIFLVQFKWSDEGSSTVVLHVHRVYRCGSNTRRGALLVVLDMQTKEMRVHRWPTPSFAVLLEINLQSRLRAMKLFP